VGEDVVESRFLGKIQIDVDRIVITGRTAVESQCVCRLMGGNVLFTTRSPTAKSFACKLMTFLISDNDGAHRFRYFVALLVCDFGCHVHDRQRSCLLVHDVADLRPKGQMSPTTTGAW
jgi:hypothetical protein